jgi:hypothetical protein
MGSDEKDRKQVPEAERVALSRAVVFLLDQREGPLQEHVWTQEKLGIALGISQEAARRAKNPAGVGPAVRDNLPKLMKLTLEQIKERFGGSGERRLDPIALASAIVASQGFPAQLATAKVTDVAIAFQEKKRSYTAEELVETAVLHLRSTEEPDLKGAPSMDPAKPTKPKRGKP